MTDNRPPSIFTRVAVLVGFTAIALIPNNPLVHAQAALGLSPAPWERFMGTYTVFSGMTESAVRLVRGDLAGAFAANFLGPILFCAASIACLTWRWPKVNTPAKETAFFIGVVSCSIAVHLVHAPG